LEHFTRFVAPIFQLALLLSLRALDDLFFGQIDIFTPPVLTEWTSVEFHAFIVAQALPYASYGNNLFFVPSKNTLMIKYTIFLQKASKNL